MKIIALFTTLLIFSSCSPYPKALHDDCRLFLVGFRSQWERQPNGFYVYKDLNGPRKSKIFTNAYLLDQEWTQHQNCLYQLSPKEVKRIFGKPSIADQGYNELEKFHSVGFYYFIKDTTCNPQMKHPYIPGAYEYNRITFAFYNGKQSKLLPRLELPCEKW